MEKRDDESIDFDIELTLGTSYKITNGLLEIRMDEPSPLYTEMQDLEPDKSCTGSAGRTNPMSIPITMRLKSEILALNTTSTMKQKHPSSLNSQAFQQKNWDYQQVILTSPFQILLLICMMVKLKNSSRSVAWHCSMSQRN